MTDVFLIDTLSSNARLCSSYAKDYHDLSLRYSKNGVTYLSQTYERLSRNYAAAAERLECAIDFIRMNGDAQHAV